MKFCFFHHQFSKLKESDTRAAEFIGIKESTLMRKATGQSSNKVCVCVTLIHSFIHSLIFSFIHFMGLCLYFFLEKPNLFISNVIFIFFQSIDGWKHLQTILPDVDVIFTDEKEDNLASFWTLWNNSRLLTKFVVVSNIIRFTSCLLHSGTCLISLWWKCCIY